MLFVFVSNVKINFPSYHHHMKPTSATQRSTVISLLKEGYSLHQIESKTGLGRSTIGRIKKETYLDKENSKGGHPSKLSSRDTQSIIRQITTGKLDNATQATHFHQQHPSFSCLPSISEKFTQKTELWLCCQAKTTITQAGSSTKPSQVCSKA